MTDKMSYIQAHMHEAFGGPYGSRWKRWFPWFCKHERVRCVHGDEIIRRRWRRRACMICGRSLKGELPTMCFFTGQPHSGYKHDHELGLD